jgi:hypothetical protein
MFKVGDKVVCVLDGDRTYLTNFKIYGIHLIEDGMIHVKDDINNISAYFPYRFIKYNYRKEKILKLKERICLKSVIE